VKLTGRVEAASAAFSFLEGNLKSNKWDGIAICERSLRITAHFTRVMSCKRVSSAGAASAEESEGSLRQSPGQDLPLRQSHSLRSWLGLARDDIRVAVWISQMAGLSHLLPC